MGIGGLERVPVGMGALGTALRGPLSPAFRENERTRPRVMWAEKGRVSRGKPSGSRALSIDSTSALSRGPLAPIQITRGRASVGKAPSPQDVEVEGLDLGRGL